MTLHTTKPVPSLSADEHGRLDRSFIKGVAWTGASKWSIQLITWVTTFVVARLLTPDDYGIVAMASVYTGLLALLTEFGIGSAIVMLSGLSEDQIAQINTLSILLGIAGNSIGDIFWFSPATSSHHSLGLGIHHQFLADGAERNVAKGASIQSPFYHWSHTCNSAVLRFAVVCMAGISILEPCIWCYAEFRTWRRLIKLFTTATVGNSPNFLVEVCCSSQWAIACDPAVLVYLFRC